MLYGNHIRTLIRRRTELNRFQEFTYGLWVKGCYTDTQRGPASYTETIYTLLAPSYSRLFQLIDDNRQFNNRA